MRRTPRRPVLLFAALTLFGCDQDPAEDLTLCPAPAVAVHIDGDRWCAHHDVARFTCPDDLPIRQGHQGVAFCGPRAVDDALADRIARAALRTGEVLERGNVIGFEVPFEWHAAPGAPSDTPLEVQVHTFTPSNTSWSTGDGDPFLCTRRFETFEVEPDGPGQLRITAWDRLRCGPGEIGHGAESRETLPLTLPGLTPGHHTLIGAAPGFDTTDATVLVGLDALCPDARPIDACFRGAFFADCGAAEGLEPAIWCDPEAHLRCVWAECPPAGFFTQRCDDDIYCPSPHIGWGPEPWSRERGMALDVAIDAALPDEPVRVECVGDAEGWRDRICRPAPDAWVAVRSPGEGDDWGWPSLVTMQAWPADGDLGEGWSLMLEVDAFAEGGPRARACLVSYSDGGTSGEPVCADAGRVMLDRLPEAAADVASLRATVHAEFPDFERDVLCSEPCVTRGLVIDARL